MMRRLRFVAAFVVASALLAETAFAQDSFARLSPFTEVDVVGDVANVVYEGKRYELLSVEGIPTPKILAFCRAEHERNWESRFATDLVEVMAALGKRIGPTVRMELRDPVTGGVSVVERAPRTRENREAARVALVNHPWRRITPVQVRGAGGASGQAREQSWTQLT